MNGIAIEQIPRDLDPATNQFSIEEIEYYTRDIFLQLR